MKRTSQQRIQRRTRAAARRQPISWGYFVLTVVCGSILALGFFLVAVQHFVAIDLSFKNSSLRKQVQDLEAEKRRLLLAKEVALSPTEITRTATKLGFREADAVIAVETQAPAAPTVELARTDNRTAPAAKPAVERTTPADDKKVVKTAMSAPVRADEDTRPRRVQTEKETQARMVTTIARLR